MTAIFIILCEPMAHECFVLKSFPAPDIARGSMDVMGKRSKFKEVAK